MYVCMNEYMYACMYVTNRTEEKRKRKEMYKPISSLRSMEGKKELTQKRMQRSGGERIFLLSGRLLQLLLLASHYSNQGLGRAASHDPGRYQVQEGIITIPH